jgi:HD-GYP domain-containing protein (c-di-GMP phosphodiesterase class II)
MVLEGPDEADLRHYWFSCTDEPLNDAWESTVSRRESLSAFAAFAAFDAGERAVIYNSVELDPRLSDYERYMARAAGLASILVAPLEWNYQIRGAVAVCSRETGAFNDDEADFLVSVADQISAILKQQQLARDLTTAHAQVSRLQDDTVMMLAMMAEAHDETTGAHLRGLRGVAELLGNELALPHERVRLLGQASMLHDIGKVRVSAKTLSKPGPLTERQRKVMQNHSIWGEALLIQRPGFELAAQIARWHHERWDGAGYPDGISGEAIPLEVAVVTVADAYDAMIRARPYKPSLPLKWVVGEIQRCSEKQFNPRVVEALDRLNRRGLLEAAEQVSF